MEEWLQTNRANWDDRVAIHLGSRFYDVEGWLHRAAGPRRREVEALGDVAGLRLVHLQCHFGLDTLAWARVGARVTGLDFSPVAIEAARDLARRAGLADRAEFVCADVYRAGEVLGGATFDVVYVSLGALWWLPSVDRWAEQVGALVAPGGRAYLHDIHPLTLALAENQPSLEYPYFETDEPFIEDSPQTYTDADRPVEHQRSYGWNHGIGETVTTLIRHGLRLETLTEYPWYVHQQYPWMVLNGDGNWTNPPGVPAMPFTYAVLASRPALEASARCSAPTTLG